MSIRIIVITVKSVKIKTHINEATPSTWETVEQHLAVILSTADKTETIIIDCHFLLNQ